MAKHINFYENLTEALIRLKNTVVTYDGLPYYIWTLTDHADGIIRVYMTEVEKVHSIPGGIPAGNSVPHGHAQMAGMMDQWMVNNPNFITRKHMNSPAFNRFKPFPLGMMNQGGSCSYVVRQPVRPKTEQGLVNGMLFSSAVSLEKGHPPRGVDMFSEEFRSLVLGEYPSPKEVLEGLSNPKFSNRAVGFHREFALVRGPIDILFLAYKDEVIGVLPNGDLRTIRLGKEFKHAKEVVDELNLFSHVVTSA